MKFQSVLGLIGNTPLLNISKLFPLALQNQVQVWCKLERANPSASIKDRIALAMINHAEASGQIKPDTTIIEPTSGNTGIGLAMVCGQKGYKLTLVMPESMSLERRKIMKAFGATLELTPRELGMKGAIAKAVELVENTPQSWMPQQFENSANPQIHATTTATEIIRDFGGDQIDHFITGVGTGGHLTGVGKILKQHFPKIHITAVEPADSPVLSGGSPGPHPLQGIGPGFVPKILDRSLIDSIVKISKDSAFEFTRESARQLGLLVGVSTGASFAAVAQRLPLIAPGSNVLTFNYDTGERYLSIEGLF